MGFPGETEDTISDTRGLIDIAVPDFFRAQLWYCDPTTPIWLQREELGLSGSGFSWRHRTMDCSVAADWVAQLFFEVSTSACLPQHGFEPWSLYYLQ